MSYTHAQSMPTKGLWRYAPPVKGGNVDVFGLFLVQSERVLMVSSLNGDCVLPGELQQVGIVRKKSGSGTRATTDQQFARMHIVVWSSFGNGLCK